MRNAFPRRLQRAFRFAASPAARLVGRALTASARLSRTPVEWTAEQGPLFGNTLGRLILSGSAAELVLSRSGSRDGQPVLEEVLRNRLDDGGAAGAARSPAAAADAR